jgi:hypothetical protein
VAPTTASHAAKLLRSQGGADRSSMKSAPTNQIIGVGDEKSERDRDPGRHEQTVDHSARHDRRGAAVADDHSDPTQFLT